MESASAPHGWARPPHGKERAAEAGALTGAAATAGPTYGRPPPSTVPARATATRRRLPDASHIPTIPQEEE